MKNTGNAGYPRKIDDLGRVVIPIEIREKLGIQKQDRLEINVENDRIILTKTSETCIICSASNQLTKIKNKHVCSSCMDEMNTI